MFYRIIIISFFMLIAFKVQSQNSIVAVGGDNFGTNGSVSYSIGQVDYINFSDSILSLSEGVQQPFEISIVNKKVELNNNFVICAYPNPVTKTMIIKWDNHISENANYQLSDILGNYLESGQIIDTYTFINFDNRVSGTYFVKITYKNSTIKTYKIIVI